MRTAHGIRGEIFVQLFAERADWLDAVESLTLSRPGFLPPTDRVIEAVRPHKEGLIVALVGVETRNDAEALKGAHVYIPEDALVSEPGETVYLAEVEGFSVVDLAGEVIGEVCGFSSNTSQDLIIVQTPKGRALIPFIEPFLLNIDFDKREVRMDLPPGLIDLEENR